MSVHQQMREMLARRSELTPSEETRLQGHLHSCVECRQTAADYAHQTMLLRALPLAIPPASLRARVLSGIHDAPAPRVWFTAPALGSLAAALIVIVAAAAYLGRPQHHSPAAAGLHPRSTAVPSTRPAPVATLPRAFTGSRFGTSTHRIGKPARPRTSPRHPAATPFPPLPAGGIAQAVPAPVPTNAPVHVAPVAPAIRSGQVHVSTPHTPPVRTHPVRVHSIPTRPGPVVPIAPTAVFTPAAAPSTATPTARPIFVVAVRATPTATSTVPAPAAPSLVPTPRVTMVVIIFASPTPTPTPTISTPRRR